MKSLRLRPANRFQAFAVHLSISAVIFIVLALVIVLRWYPDFLFTTDGGWRGIRLIAGVDFIIGPTLTLIVYKAGKRGLKYDLLIIAMIQLACLTWGTWIVYKERPIAIFYYDGLFQPKSHLFFDMYEIDPEQVYRLDERRPAWVYIHLPEDKEERLQALMSVFQKGPVYAQVERYRPFRENLEKIMGNALDPAELDQEIRNSMTESGKIFNYSARYGDGYIEINRNTGEYVNIH